MTDIFKPINDDRNGTPTAVHDPYGQTPPPAAPSSDAGRTALIGLLGGVLSAAGYLVYSRLPDDQKGRVNSQVRTLVESRVNELRSRFNI
ncbi:MAG: hypothetical protein NVSMB19_17620 [Vulcanimicrobiaceae bacterium]